MNTFFKHKALRALGWFGIALIAVYFMVVTFRAIYFVERDKTEAVVSRAHSSRITLDDVLGKNLPPNPGREAEKTVAGIDANLNGVRDDVELAIFKKYPRSARTRAPLLQYAFNFQAETIQPFLNMEIVTEIVERQFRADICLSDSLVPRDTPESSRTDEQTAEIAKYQNFIKDLQFNTSARKQAHEDFLVGRLGSFGQTPGPACDINSLTLPD